MTADATIHLIDGTGVVRIDDRFPTDPDDLWLAVTDPERLSRWLATVVGDLHVGGRFAAVFTSGWEGPGRVDVCDPPRRLRLTMDPEGPAPTVISVDLTPEGDGTRMVLEESGFTRKEVAAHGAGWGAHIDDLRAHLDGRPAGDWRSRWAELAPAYERRAADL